MFSRAQQEAQDLGSLSLGLGLFERLRDPEPETW